MMPTLLILPALAWAVLGAPQDPDATLDGSKPVLSIDGTPISADEYTRWLIDTGGSSYARDFAERWVILRAAEERGIEVTDEQVRATLDKQIEVRIQGAFRGEKQEWVAELERLERSEGGYLRQMMTDLRPEVAAKAIAAQGRVVPEDKVARDWELHYGPYGQDLDLRMMYFQVEVETGEGPEAQAENTRLARDAQESVALNIRQRLLDGEDFGQLASMFCDDAELRESGGVPSKAFRRGGWPHGFIDSLCELEVGELSEPLYARGGWWLVRLEGRTETPLEQVRESLTAALIQKGPEQDEIGRVWNALAEDVYYELSPELFGEATGLEDGDETLGLIVNGEPIPRRVFAAWMLWIRGEFQSRHFSEDWLVTQRARAAGIEISEQAAEARAQSFIDWMITYNRSYRGSREAWIARLSTRGQTVEDFMREKVYRARLDLMAQELILRERVVTEEMVTEEFERQFGDEERWLEVRMLQVDATPPIVTSTTPREEVEALEAAALEAARQEAAGYVQRLRAGEDFAVLARQHSDERATAADGGRVPGRFRPDAWPADVAAAVRALELGGISAPLYGGRGSYLVFELVEDRELDLEQAREDIRTELREREPTPGDIAGYRNVLSKQAEIRLLPGMWD